MKGVLEILSIEESGEEGLFGSSRDGQLLRGRWQEILPDLALPYLKYHTANVFENKLYLVGGYSLYDDINGNIVVINLGTDNTKPSVLYKEVSGDRYFKPRVCHSSVQYRDRIYYFGGIDEEQNHLNDMWAFNPYSFQWQEIEYQSLIPSPRANCLTQIVGDTIFVMGGDNLFGTCGDLLTFKIGSSSWGRRNNGLPDIKEPNTFCIYENTLIFGQNFDLYSLDLGIVEKAVIGGSDDSNFRVSDRKLFLEKTYADITFNVEGQKILAHKAIVASRSSHFRNMFESGMKETNSNVIDVPEMKAETFKGFLEYLYCGELEFTEETAIDLLKLSDKFCVSGLRSLCEKFLITALKAKNAISLTSLADFCGALKLKEAGLMYMGTNFDEVFDSQDIRTLPSTLIMELFKYKNK